MAIGDLNPAVWRIDVYELKPDSPFSGVITDLSNLYTSDLTITKQRNYPDEIRFTLDLQQLEERAKNLTIASRDIIEPYKHKIRCYRNNEFVAQGIVIKTTTNLNNESKNTIEVQCVDTLTLFEKRLIHQDYGEGSWADFAKEVVKDAQHEPNRIYNYAWEGDGVSVDNAWFRGWKYLPGEDALKDYPEWEPNKLYSMYDTCTHDAKFWEAKEHAFYSGETFSTANWTLLGILDEETGEVQAAYGVWREDNEDPGPTGTALGGWGGTSSCHMTTRTFSINNGSGTAISMKDSSVSTSLVAPFEADATAPRLPDGYIEVEYLQSTYGTTSAEVGPYIDTGVNVRSYNSRLKVTVDAEIPSTASNNAWNTICGVAYGLKDGTWYWNPQFQLCVNDSNQVSAEYPDNANEGTNTSGVVLSEAAPLLTRATYVLDALESVPSLTFNGNTYYGDKDVGDSANYGPDGNLFVFARNILHPEDVDLHRRGNNCCPGKIYSVKIESKYRVIRDFVPCTHDSVPGFYDVQNGKFYPSAGTGMLTAGPVVPYNRVSSDHIHTRAMIEDTTALGYQIDDAEIDTMDVFSNIDIPTFKRKLLKEYPQFNTGDEFVDTIYAEEYEES